MTPKEEAQELFDKYDNILYKEYNNLEAKKCALIAVEFSRQFITGDLSESFDKTMYLFEIKEEIGKL
jgi:hypothetical protein